MISNNICENCSHATVCETSRKKLFVFHEDAKQQLGVDISIDNCKNFNDIEKSN